jgi:hypothetical protein
MAARTSPTLTSRGRPPPLTAWPGMLQPVAVRSLHARMSSFLLVDDTAKISKSTTSNIGAFKVPLPSAGRQTIPSALLSSMKTVADQFAETLAAAGVKRIYGIVGDSLNDAILSPAWAAFASGW